MNKSNLLQDLFNTIHYLYLKHKHLTLALFLGVLVVSIMSSQPALGEMVVAGVSTQVKISFDGKTKTYSATQNTVRGALEQAGVTLKQNDISDPPLGSKINGGNMHIKVTRALPVLISDNNQEHLAFSAYTNETEILKQLNIETYPEDRVSTSLILDPADENSVGQKVTIERAPVYSIEVDGGTRVVRGWSKESAEIVRKAAITMGPQDIIEPKAGTPLVPGQRIVITRINEFDESVNEAIPFETVYQGSYSVAFGKSTVTQVGVNGAAKKTYHVVYKNGVEVARSLIATAITSPKQNKIISTGIISGRANFGYYSGMVTSFYKGMTGRYLLVTNLSNGKQVKVRIIGSGPFNGPLMDMGTEPFQAIGGSLSSGYIPQVSVQLVD